MSQNWYFYKAKNFFEKRLQFQQEAFRGTENQILFREIKRTFQKLVNRKRISLQLLENGKNKNYALKRISILLKNLTSTFSNFDLKVSLPINVQNSTQMQNVKSFIVIPGYKNLIAESYNFENIMTAQEMIIMNVAC